MKQAAWDVSHSIRYEKNSKEEVLKLSFSQTVQDLPLFTFPLLDKTGLVKHCFTTRKGGASKGIFSSLNLSFTRGDEKEAVEENFNRVAKALGVSRENFVFTDQTHTTKVIRVTKEDAGKGLLKKREYTDVDGMVTNEPGVVLSAFFADCVPLYFVDPVKKAVGLSHSGWRGTVGRMGKATVEAMEREFKSSPGDLICGIGPSICGGCYEVGEDVAEKFRREFQGHEGEILQEKGDGRYLLDLWKANKIVLLEAGVKREHLSITNVCTCCNPKLLFSHRASRGRRGNLGAFLVLSE